MTWQVLFHDEFEQEFDAWHQALQDELFAQALSLKQSGPNLGRPWVDTLNGSRYPNMKELRFSWRGAPWRVAFAFDPQRQAVLLVGGAKGGVNQRRFYARLIRTADARYERHLEFLRKEAEHGHGIG
ncbi:MAG: type II toxin-antitoxin system RelE/ParE family toxin [Ottowia sp.]|nr:type II toxin-antitoxin system RelE/ParE family toxin [Ottowia sp.]